MMTQLSRGWRPSQLSSASKQDLNLPDQCGYPQRGGAAKVQIITKKREKPVHPQPSFTWVCAPFQCKCFVSFILMVWLLIPQFSPVIAFWVCRTGLTYDQLHDLFCRKCSMSQRLGLGPWWKLSLSKITVFSFKCQQFTGSWKGWGSAQLNVK